MLHVTSVHESQSMSPHKPRCQHRVACSSHGPRCVGRTRGLLLLTTMIQALVLFGAINPTCPVPGTFTTNRPTVSNWYKPFSFPHDSHTVFPGHRLTEYLHLRHFSGSDVHRTTTYKSPTRSWWEPKLTTDVSSPGR